MSDEGVQTGRSARARRTSAPRDPVTRYLLWAVYAGLILFLVGIVFALWFGVIDPPAPRTLEERRLALLEKATETRPQNPETWAELVSVLIATRQYARAGSVVEEGKKATRNAPLLLAAEASLAAARGRDEQAMVLANRAIEAARKERDKELANLQEKGIAVAPRDIPAPALIAAALVRGEVAARTGNWQVAVEAYTAALEADPRMGDVLISRGDAHAELGDLTAAEADYRAALQYLPESEAALDGLKKIGVQE